MAKKPTGLCKDLAKLVNEVCDCGWVVERTRGGHIRFVSPDGRSVFTSSTPSDYRSVLNARSKLKRNGCPL